MTKAYEKGFMDKCAECGVDGTQLLKRAQAALGKMFDVGAWWPKYVDLLKGGNNARKAIRAAFKSNYAGAGGRYAGKSLTQTLRHLEGEMNRLTSEFRGGKGMFAGTAKATSGPAYEAAQKAYAEAMKPLMADYAALSSPLEQLERNVLLARLGTGGALAAGGLYGLNKVTGDDYDGYSARRPVRPRYV